MNQIEATLKKEITNDVYRGRYLAFIQYCQDHPPRPGDYYEAHHILPKAIFPGIRSESWNLVNLTPRQHYLAHWILAKVFLCRRRHSCIKAFHRMTCGHKGKRYTSATYAYNRLMLSRSMKESNPMHNLSYKLKSMASCKRAWTPERRAAVSKARVGVNFITPDGVKRLSDMWTGVSRPKTKDQVSKIVRASSCGLFVTPFGEFDSPGMASRSPSNTAHYSRYTINKMCKAGTDGFQFIPNGRVEKRGHWKKSIG